MGDAFQWACQREIYALLIFYFYSFFLLFSVKESFFFLFQFNRKVTSFLFEMKWWLLMRNDLKFILRNHKNEKKAPFLLLLFSSCIFCCCMWGFLSQIEISLISIHSIFKINIYLTKKTTRRENKFSSFFQQK